jgi:methylated-DNA-[protein]-cysteine S-methyltransferase
MQLLLSRLESPLGDLLLVTDTEHNIRALDFATHEAHLRRGLREHYGSVVLTNAPVSTEIAQAIARYFLREPEVASQALAAREGDSVSLPLPQVARLPGF